MINDISTPILQIFQGQMASTVQCAHCDKVTTTTAHTQDISLHVDADSNTSLGERLLNFFQPETLEGDNSYWCDTCIRPCRAKKNTLLQSRSHNLNYSAEKTDSREENPDSRALRHGVRYETLSGSRAYINPSNGTDRYHYTPGYKRTGTLRYNNKKRKRMDFIKWCHSNPSHSNDVIDVY